MPDMTFDEAIARIYKWIPVSVSEKIENTLRDRVAELERVNGISIEEIHILQNQSTSKSEKVAELEREVAKYEEGIILQIDRERLSLRSDNAAMRALLKECEWVNINPARPHDLECPSCHNNMLEGHTPDCAWGKFANGENNG